MLGGGGVEGKWGCGSVSAGSGVYVGPGVQWGLHQFSTRQICLTCVK